MTKLEKLKNEIGYTKESKQCQNCFYFKSDIVTGLGYNKQYSEEKNLRCGKYDFATKKTTSCDEHEEKAN